MTPPQHPLRLLRWFCREDFIDEIEGDLTEIFRKEYTRSPRVARWKFAWRVLKYFRPEFIKSFRNYQPNAIAMYKSYLKISFRQLTKNKVFTFINLSGLTLGFTCFMLLGLYIYDELSFDMFHRDAARIYRVVQHEQQDDGSIRKIVPVAPLLGQEAGKQFREIEEVCRVTAFGRVTMGNEPASRSHERIISTDPNFFTFFDFPLVEGDPRTVLLSPNTVVVSEKLAKKYFGAEPATGKQIWTGFNPNGKPLHVTVAGVMRDFPKNSHLQFGIIFSDATWPSLFRWYNEYITTNWDGNDYVTYIKVAPEADIAHLPGQITDLVKSHHSGEQPFKSNYTLQTLGDIHLHSADMEGQGSSFDASMKPFYIYMFAAVGALLLIIACLNYMNLSTAAAFKRTREIGTRKSLGAHKRQLTSQFLVDAVLLTALSVLVSVGLVFLLLPWVNEFSGKELTLRVLPLWSIAAVCIMVVVVAVFSSLYPALIASRVSAVDALKSEIRIGRRGFPVRKALLVVQFTISISMIASTVVIYRQLGYMRDKDLGFNHENLLVVDINSRPLRQNMETVKAEFGKLPEVSIVSASTRVPGEWKSFPVATVKSAGDSRGHELIYVGIDEDFLETYNIRLLEGRTIGDPKSDSLKVLLTKLGAEQLGLTNPVGQMIEIPTYKWGGSTYPLETPFRAEVIGLVDDFHFESLRNKMMPVIFGAPNTVLQEIDYYTLRVNTANWDETLDKLKTINTQIDPDNPLEYTFLDSRFEEFYRADARRGQIFLTFSAIIVAIACMGLFALVSYSVESRIKEIGVRKVLGASTGSIVRLISREFLLLVLLAGVVGLPAAAFFMNSWLQEFAYRVPMNVWMFAAALSIAVVIAFATIFVRTFRAAQANPVNNLRSE